MERGPIDLRITLLPLKSPHINYNTAGLTECRFIGINYMTSSVITQIMLNSEYLRDISISTTKGQAT